MTVTHAHIAAALHTLGLGGTSAVIAHSSLRSFGHVEGGADTLARALVETCGTVLVPSGTWSVTGLPAPPGPHRPDNAAHTAASWAEFDAALAAARPYAPDLPVDGWLGRTPEAIRRLYPGHVRGSHPLFGFLAVGDHAERLIAAERIDDPLGPIAGLAALDGDVLLVGVGHTANTAIHLAEQRLGRGRFHRYAAIGPGCWAEFPNVPGESHRFDDIEPDLAPATRVARVGDCLIRRVPVTEVLAAATRLIEADPGALLCRDDDQCRCHAALRQRLAAIGTDSSSAPRPPGRLPA